jgi:hypothetical protein
MISEKIGKHPTSIQSSTKGFPTFLDCNSRSIWSTFNYTYRHSFFKYGSNRLLLILSQKKLSTNLNKNSKACIQAINSSKWFWLSSLIQGSFRYPGVRLYVEIGDLRPANREERFAIARRIKPLQWTKEVNLSGLNLHMFVTSKLTTFAGLNIQK